MFKKAKKLFYTNLRTLAYKRNDRLYYWANEHAWELREVLVLPKPIYCLIYAYAMAGLKYKPLWPLCNYICHKIPFNIRFECA
jgi:hypothetical protein